MAASQSQSEQPSFWTEKMIKALQRIMGGNMKNSLAYMKMVERLNAQGIACSKAQLISKIKYLKTQFTNRQKANRSGASTDAIYKVCPYWDQLSPILKMNLTSVIPQYLAATQVNEL